MALIHVGGTVQLDDAFSVTTNKSLDARSVVQTTADLINPAVWTNSSLGINLPRYHGMQVSVVADPAEINNGVYFLRSASSISVNKMYGPDNGITHPNGWRKIDSLDSTNNITTDNISIIGDGTTISPYKVGIVNAGTF